MWWQGVMFTWPHKFKVQIFNNRENHSNGRYVSSIYQRAKNKDESKIIILHR